MHTYQHTFHRFQIECIQYGTGYRHRVDYRTGRESKSEIRQRITFIIVLNSIRKVYRVSSIRLESILQSNHNFLSIGFYLRLLHLWRRNHNLLTRFIKLDEFIEFNRYFFPAIIERTRQRRTTHKAGGSFINSTTLRTTDAGAGIKHSSNDDNTCQTIEKRFHI